MKKASITEARNTLSALIDGLRSGSGVPIVDRDPPVARLEPITTPRGTGQDQLSGLVRDEIVRPGRTPLARSVIDTAPPSSNKDASVLRALLEERRPPTVVRARWTW